MMSTSFTYRRGAELPGLVLPWQEQLTATTWGDLNLSTGYTFTLTLVDAAGTVETPGATITGSDGSVAIAWATDDLDITPGRWTLKLRARETATSKDRDYSPGNPPIIVITS